MSTGFYKILIEMKLKMIIRNSLILGIVLTAQLMSAQCWYVDDATDSVCLTDPADSCIPITYPNGTPANFIEALSIDPSGAPVYAADAGQVGILDPATGIFTPFANASGYADLDGLAWDPNANKLYASVRSAGNDELVCIEISGPNAGLPIAGTEVEVTGSGSDVDELTVPPNSCSNAGTIYATIATATGFVLATIDPASGVATEIGSFGIPDVESITFDANCNLYANTGTGALYLVDQATGAVIGDPIINVNGTDVEGMSCEDSTPFGASISNYIWEDTNGDGVQDPGEDGIAGIVLNLLDDMGNPVLDPSGNPITATTDANGEYIFDNLPAGDYTVQIDPSNYLAGGPLDGYAQTFDEDGAGDGEIDVMLDSNEDHITADFGFQGTASIGDTIWEDTNGDGIQDPGETGIAGVTVTLYDDMGNVVATAITDANGNYDFLNLPPGDYTVTVTPPAGYDNTGDPDGTFDNTTDVTLGPGEDNNVEDFGYQGNGSIGDTIWEDTNGDGIQDPGEAGIAGVTVTLYDDMGNVVATAITDANGNYDFIDLPPGDYTVTVTPPAGYDNTGDPDGTFDSTTDVTLGPGEDIDVEDFGYQGNGSIGDTIWEDTNGDGVEDPGEAGIAGVTVTLYDDMGNVVATAITDANGNYDFIDLPPGDYTVTVTPPAGYDNTGDPDGTFDSTTDVTLGPGEDIDVEDFGYQGNGSIGDTIWEDTNGDGVEDPGEAGIAGVTVTLYDDMGNVVATAITDANGNYDFIDLPPGDYTVTVTPPAGYDNTGDPDGTFDSTTDVTLGPGEDIDVEDFGYQGNGSISNQIWEDLDADGTMSPGEAGIAGVVVELLDDMGNPVLDAAGNAITATTDANGEYMFDNLPPGDYTVELAASNFVGTGALAAYFQTYDEDGSDDATIDVALDPGEDHITADFGFAPVALPVDFIKFTAQKNGTNIDLDWTTATEINNDRFEIEHSSDGKLYASVGQVSGAGSTYEEIDYNFSHRTPSSGQNLYRIKQIDINGRSMYSEIRTVEFSTDPDRSNVYPNPFNNVLNIESAYDNYQVYNATGELLKSGKVSQYQIDMSDLIEGIYFINLFSENEQTTMRIVKR